MKDLLYKLEGKKEKYSLHNHYYFRNGKKISILFTEFPALITWKGFRIRINVE